MNELNIGEIIYQLRKEKGITQETLSEFLGISKPAVSKWETGQSFPDITLLPIIASYFDVTIDYLMNFSPSISHEEAMDLYHKFADDFSTKPFDEVLSHIKNILKKYHNCYFLHLQIGNLLINHLDCLEDVKRIPEILSLSAKILRRVAYRSSDATIVHQAKYSLALCELSLGNADETIEILKSAVDTSLPPELLISQAYILKGDLAEGKSILQGYVFQCLVGLLNACPSLGLLNLDNPKKGLKWFKWLSDTMKAFEFDKVNPFGEGQMHISYAKAYAAAGDYDSALSQLEYFAQVASNPSSYPVSFKESDMFDCISKFYEKLDLGTGAHRSDKAIKDSFLKSMENIVQDTAFKPIENNPRYLAILKQLA